MSNLDNKLPTLVFNLGTPTFILFKLVYDAYLDLLYHLAQFPL